MVGPELAASGAVPLKEANRSRVAKRSAWPTAPKMVAAPTGPIPTMSVSVVPVALTSWSSRRVEDFTCRRRLDVVEELSGDLESVGVDGRVAFEAVQEGGCPGQGDAAGLSAGGELQQQGVEPVGLGRAPLGEVAVAFGGQRQRGGVIPDRDGPQRRVSQRADGNRAGVVAVGLVRAAGAQHPHPRRQAGRHIEHRLARGHELLGDQQTETAGGLDGPGSFLEPVGPASQPLGLGRGCSHRGRGQHRLGVVDRHRRVGRLVGIDPDHHAHR